MTKLLAAPPAATQCNVGLSRSPSGGVAASEIAVRPAGRVRPSGRPGRREGIVGQRLEARESLGPSVQEGNRAGTRGSTRFHMDAQVEGWTGGEQSPPVQEMLLKPPEEKRSEAEIKAFCARMKELYGADRTERTRIME